MDGQIYRYGSFANFPREVQVYPTRLAEAGFYYEGNGDEVVCFSCGVKYKGWKENDYPLQIHKNISPHCRFVNDGVINSSTEDRQPVEPKNENEMSHNKDNKAFENTRTASLPPSAAEGDDHGLGACGGPSDIKNRGNKQCETQNSNFVAQTTVGESVLSESKNKLKTREKEGQMKNQKVGDKKSQCIEKKPENKSESSLTLDPLGISFERPVYPQYAITTVRLSSFRDWPKQLKQKPDDLAKAGFFHEGVADKVRCFFCGGGLINWDPEDEPWTEHARWYPRCVYLRQSKGDDFIYKVQAGLETPEEKPKTESIDPLSHTASKSVIDMGCKPDTVRHAWDCLFAEIGQENITAEKLLMKVWKLEDENVERSPSFDNHGVSEETKSQHDPEKEITSESNQKEDLKEFNQKEKLAIAEENRQLKEQQTCKICLDEDVAIVFLPCGHMAACASCAPALRKCPICRTFIKGTVRAILS